MSPVAHARQQRFVAAWVASLGESERDALGSLPDDVIWVPGATHPLVAANHNHLHYLGDSTKSPEH